MVNSEMAIWGAIGLMMIYISSFFIIRSTIKKYLAQAKKDNSSSFIVGYVIKEFKKTNAIPVVKMLKNPIFIVIFMGLLMVVIPIVYPAIVMLWMIKYEKIK